MVFLIANSGVSPTGVRSTYEEKRILSGTLEGRVDILARHRSVEEGTPRGKQGAEQTVLRVQRSKFLESEEKKKAVCRVKIRKLCLL